MKVRYRTTPFGGALIFVAGAFAGLMLLVATMPSFAIKRPKIQAVAHSAYTKGSMVAAKGDHFDRETLAFVLMTPPSASTIL